MADHGARAEPQLQLVEKAKPDIEEEIETQSIASVNHEVHGILLTCTHRIIRGCSIMSHSPRTPTPPKLPSGMDFSFASASPPSYIVTPQHDSYHSPRLFQSHRTSLYSIPSPSTSQPPSSHERQGSFGLVNGFGSVPLDQGNDGLGNLADELAEAWEDDGQGEPEEGGLEPKVEGTHAIPKGVGDLCKIDTTAEVVTSPIWTNPSSPSKRQSRPKHHRQFSCHDEPDYGNDCDGEGDKDTPLSARMVEIESLARQGVENNGTQPDPLVQRVASSLKDLGSQAGLENGATR